MAPEGARDTDEDRIGVTESLDVGGEFHSVFESGSELFIGDVLDRGIPRTETFDVLVVDVEANHTEPAVDRRHGEGQANISQTDDPCRPRLVGIEIPGVAHPSLPSTCSYVGSLRSTGPARLVRGTKPSPPV